MTKGFEIAPDLQRELEKIGERFNPDAYAEKTRALAEAASQSRKKRRSLGRKFRDFFRSLIHLPRLNRRIDRMGTDLDVIRDSLVEDIQHQFKRNTKTLIQILENHAATTRQVIEEDRVRAGDRIENIAALIARQDETITGLRDQLRLEQLTRQRAYTALDRRLLQLRTSRTESGEKPDARFSVSGERDVEALLQTFYQMLEDRYRGTREEIRARLSIYRNDLRAARERTGETGLAIDIGCGRGELLEVMREEKLNAIGIDLNDLQLDMARQHGLPVVHGDALAYLQGLDDNSAVAISAVHLIEHLPFAQLIKLAEQIERVLKPGGVVIFETPNPRNLIVGATTFNFDPTHIKPLPFEITELLLETVGFPEVEFRPLHASDTFDAVVNAKRLDRDIALLLFGPQDYAAVAVKSRAG